MLIKSSPLFGCRGLPRDQPVEVGRTDIHVVFRIGPWTIACEIPRDVRYPEVERVIPPPAEVTTRLRLDPEDAAFLEAALGRLPGAGENNAPVTIEVNGEVAVRATASDQPDSGHRAGAAAVGLHRLADLRLHESRAAGAGAEAGLHGDRVHRRGVAVRLPGRSRGSTPSSR